MKAKDLKRNRLLRKVIRRILKYPERFDMSAWLRLKSNRISNDEDARDPRFHCGTTACIAGWVSLLGSEKIQGKEATFDGHLVAYRIDGVGSIREQAMRLLRLTAHQATSLFYKDSWPQQFANKQATIDATLEGRARSHASARLAAERIEHFIKTGV